MKESFMNDGWVRHGKLEGVGSLFDPSRRATDAPADDARLTWYQKEEKALLETAYRVTDDVLQATWIEPDNPKRKPHEYFRLITTTRYCNRSYAQHWPVTAVVYLVEEDRTLSPVLECRPGRGGHEYAIYIAGETEPRIIGPDALVYITDQPHVRGRNLKEVQDGSRKE